MKTKPQPWKLKKPAKTILSKQERVKTDTHLTRQHLHKN